jgi:hypothetical protein
MHDLSQPLALTLALHGNDDRNTLLNIEHILVWHSLGRNLFLLRVAVQVQHINLIKSVQQVPAHPPKCRIVQIAVIGDEAQHAFTILFDQVR